MNWLRTPLGGYVDPLEVVVIDFDDPEHGTCFATLRSGKDIVIDDSVERTWRAVMDARRNA